ncbi:MAG: FAD-dependent oxidoreductase [Gammaproteobacteria bacterium]|jgi:flavocytochrome c|nr:FAD-dependent oxidoreductase [Gammaproteobacteria bacterium]MDP6617119.1 FAD-dependent oxidoreductase [Gammaproteobacteria bacterium]MDP6695771.1 FAD-dependent oxidoreductase [Gammaproteobacteria bacterium]
MILAIQAKLEPMHNRLKPTVGIALPALLLAVLFGCTQPAMQSSHDVIVVGAGIAGLSAALEAAEHGAKVLVLEANSVGGGHAVIAGGFAMVDTELQRKKGYTDSPEIAFKDMMAWGETADPYWVRRYARESGTDVYDWLTDAGAEFVVLIDTPEDTVPRFHFTRGTAVNVVVPLMRKAFNNPDIEFMWNTRVTALAKTRGTITGVVAVNERTGARGYHSAPSVVLATGGFQNNLDMVRANWPTDRMLPDRLLKGAGQFATGDGYVLAEWAGADMRRMDRQVTFYNGVPNPRDKTGTTALVTENPAAIWVDSNGRRFMSESGDSKAMAAAVDKLKPVSFWMLFDTNGARRLGLRGAPWIDRNAVKRYILDNPVITAKGVTLRELALKSGLPEHGIRTTIETWNRMVKVGTDFQFNRFNEEHKPRGIQSLSKAPYYALRIYPLTRKSMGGPAIDTMGRVVDADDQPVPGLYAAGELTGVAGINGSHGGAGTFLGPSVFTGRIAGRTAALESAGKTSQGLTLTKSNDALIEQAAADGKRPGYWHFDVSHRLGSERKYSCDNCHNASIPMRMAADRKEMLARLSTCTQCH